MKKRKNKVKGSLVHTLVYSPYLAVEVPKIVKALRKNGARFKKLFKTEVSIYGGCFNVYLLHENEDMTTVNVVVGSSI